ncbi:MAG: hypothetical protein AAGI49_06970 [Bacteroidota bacterium]
MEKVNFSNCTLAYLEHTFQLESPFNLSVLDAWLHTQVDLTEIERQQLLSFREHLELNVLHWNEQELSLNFIGPLFAMVRFTHPKFNFFAQRSLHATINDIELLGKTDGLLASGYRSPRLPYFAFHEFKKESDSSGDPAGQNLAAMLAGQALNERRIPIYGCFVTGENWYFMVLDGNQYAISKPYSSTSKLEVFDIFRILKGLKGIVLGLVSESP